VAKAAADADTFPKLLIHNSQTIGARPAFQRMDHRQRSLAFAQVAGHRFAENIFSGRKVKHVVYNLKREAKVAPILA